MRVVVTGASGNVGTSVLQHLGAEPAVSTIVGVARRRPSWTPAKVEWVEADITVADLDDVVAGADVVIHLAWLIQPSHDVRAMWATNVVGTARLAAAVARTGVSTVIAASSIGAYSPAPAGSVVDESWPTDGVPESSYSWQKAMVERILDAFVVMHPTCRVVRLRPALIFKKVSARHVRNLFVPKLIPRALIRTDAIVRLVRRSPLPFQVVHADDVADAVRRAAVGDASGAFNLAADEVFGDASRAGPALVSVGKPLVGAAWRIRLVPIDPGWLTLAQAAPVMSTQRAREVLGWEPQHSAEHALRELLDGLRTDAGFPTPPLEEQALYDEAVREPALDEDWSHSAAAAAWR